MSWLFTFGFWFAIGSIIFVFIGIPVISYLGMEKRVKFLPSMRELLTIFPNSLDDIATRYPYSILELNQALSLLYFELLLSLIMIKIIKRFK